MKCNEVQTIEFHFVCTICFTGDRFGSGGGNGGLFIQPTSPVGGGLGRVNSGEYFVLGHIKPTSLHGLRTITAKSQGSVSGAYLRTVCSTSRSTSDQYESWSPR